MTTWLVSIGLMIPFAVVGVLFYTHLSYGLLTDLPASSPSLAGTAALQAHFPAGATGPITLLLRNDKVDFSQQEGIELVKELTRELYRRRQELQLADIRSVSHPYGYPQQSEKPAEEREEETIEKVLGDVKNPVARKITREKIIDHYVSQQKSVADHVTRMELTATLDPFSRDSMQHLSHIQGEIARMLDKLGGKGTEVMVTGSTASIRDLKTVTDGDQIRIDILVVSSVFLILVVLLRQPSICLYLIITVLFSYLVALGATYLAWYFAFGSANFAGLDWKVPMFLFTILIAVGEDYNIFLMTRIEEEQRVYGPVSGVIHALQKTGRIISSCGIIMAGTFCSLAAGSLRGMCQLGFALAFGVLLDTFVVRPILVPAYLVLLNSGRFGRFGKLLGAQQPTEPPAPSGEQPQATS
jgi:RND superfamily putative drug exporter